ncbi:hypothetical protein GOODEAATRI_012142 [Goodea atripinnis]|uniref:Uncharacterized protein n=1 Tax=Goodea atripinnis TaxID=208336 RepID=A0ABV0MHB9_9TELE
MWRSRTPSSGVPETNSGVGKRDPVSVEGHPETGEQFQSQAVNQTLGRRPKHPKQRRARPDHSTVSVANLVHSPRRITSLAPVGTSLWISTQSRRILYLADTDAPSVSISANCDLFPLSITYPCFSPSQFSLASLSSDPRSSL